MASGEAGLRSAPLSISPWWLTMEVLQHVLDLDGKSFHPRHVSLQNLQTQGDVSYELPARRVAQAARGAKLLDLADVV